MEVEVVKSFAKVFRGRGDVYGSAKGFQKKEALTLPVFERHLFSADKADQIGVYCMIGENCSWGCIDIDGKDFPAVCDLCQGYASGHCDGNHDHDWDHMAQLSRNLVAVLAAKDITAHIEHTKNGYHVWVFPEEPLVPARYMRRALMAACVAIGYDPKEVNPKSEGPRPGTKGYGNFVRLPYGGVFRSSMREERRVERYFMPHGEDQPWALVSALEYIEEHRTPTATLAAVAELWTPPPVAHHEIDYDAGLDVEPLMPLLDGRLWTIWHDGPLPGSDRSTTLARFAHLCAARGLTATQTYAFLVSADKRWGKFQDRPEQLARMVDNAYD